MPPSRQLWRENYLPGGRVALPTTTSRQGIGNGNNGINRDQEEIIASTVIKPLSIEITAHVQPNSHYKVHFVYQGGSNGAWIQGIKVRV